MAVVNYSDFVIAALLQGTSGDPDLIPCYCYLAQICYKHALCPFTEQASCFNSCTSMQITINLVFAWFMVYLDNSFHFIPAAFMYDGLNSEFVNVMKYELVQPI